MPNLFDSAKDFWQFMFFATITLIAIFVVGYVTTEYQSASQPANHYGAIASGVHEIR